MIAAGRRLDRRPGTFALVTPLRLRFMPTR
jgi:hypothetical protein